MFIRLHGPWWHCILLNHKGAAVVAAGVEAVPLLCQRALVAGGMLRVDLA
jgi:hypothetical protein